MEISLSRVWTQLFDPSRTQGGGCLESLADDMVMDILSRLRGDQVVRLRSVCRRWCALIATPSFARLHLEKANSLIVFQACLWDYSLPNKFVLFYVDWRSKGEEQKLIGEIHIPKMPSMPSTITKELQLCGCSNGLLVFRRLTPSRDKHDPEKVPPFTYYICNPITKEQVTLRAGGEIFGFFFHSPTNKFHLLRFNQSGDDDFRFGIGSLGPMMWREAGPFPYCPREVTSPPSVVNGCLYWMAIGKEKVLPPCSHSIMVFSIEDGKFHFMPHPGKLDPLCKGHGNMQLLSTKGQLYAYSIYAKVLGIWVLEDSANWHWGKKFNIHLEGGLEQFSIRGTSLMNRIKLFDVWDDQLLLMLPKKGLFRYNPRSERVMELLFGYLGSRVREETWKCFEMINAEYTMSLVSLWDF